MAVPNGFCSSSVRFSSDNVEYKSDSDFYWYGRLTYTDSASECYKGEAMLFSESGLQYGYFIINDRNYEIVDLTGGLQLLCEVDPIHMGDKICGLERTTQSVGGTTAPDGNGGYQCKPKILVLFTQDALNTDPMGYARGALACNQFRQAVLNSGVTPFQLGVTRISDVVQYTTPTFTYSSKGISGLHEALVLMCDPGSYLGQVVTAKKAAYKADIVVLITKDITRDILRGEAALVGDPPVPTPAKPPYAVVMNSYATIADIHSRMRLVT